MLPRRPWPDALTPMATSFRPFRTKNNILPILARIPARLSILAFLNRTCRINFAAGSSNPAALVVRVPTASERYLRCDPIGWIFRRRIIRLFASAK